MFGGKSFETHNDMHRIDFNFNKWNSVDIASDKISLNGRFGQ